MKNYIYVPVDLFLMAMDNKANSNDKTYGMSRSGDVTVDELAYISIG